MKIIDREFVRLAMLRKVAEGESDIKRICRLVGISYGSYCTIGREYPKWRKKLKDMIKEAKALRYEEILERLADGVEVTEREEQWTEEEPDGNKKLVKVRFKRLPPNEKAVAMLAKKYNKELTGNEVLHKHEIGITIKDRALTMDERLALLEEDRNEGQVIETTGEVVGEEDV